MAASTMLAVIIYLHDLLEFDETFNQPDSFGLGGINEGSWVIMILVSARC